jgi:hypothetical protein
LLAWIVGQTGAAVPYGLLYFLLARMVARDYTQPNLAAQRIGDYDGIDEPAVFL